jgi:hypothetical protein
MTWLLVPNIVCKFAALPVKVTASLYVVCPLMPPTLTGVTDTLVNDFHLAKLRSESESVHVAPFLQGLLEHSSTSISQLPRNETLAALSDTVHAAV